MKKLKIISIAILCLVVCLSISACSYVEDNSPPLIVNAPVPIEEPVAPQENYVATLPAENPASLPESGDGSATDQTSHTDAITEDDIYILAAPLPTTGMPDVPFPWPNALPQHVPGSIRLRDADSLRADFYLPYTPQLRAAFYMIPGCFEDLVQGRPGAIVWINENLLGTGDNDYPYIMPLLRFVQHFNISREEFVAVAEGLREAYIALGHDITDELFEIPNADIIFTFDNDIIRYFYRRA